VRKIVDLLWRHRLSPLAIGPRLSVPASTVHAVLVRCRLNRLSHIDIRTGELIRRYEHERPAAMIHLDVKKLGNIPAWRFVGRAQGKKNRTATPGVKRNRHRGLNLGQAFEHTVIDDHSRVAYAEIYDAEPAVTAIAVLHRAVGCFRHTGLPSSVCCLTRAAATNLAPGATHAPNCASCTNERGPIGHRPTANSSAFTEPWPANGPSPTTPQRRQPPISPNRMAAHLHSPPATLGNRQEHAHQPINQPARAVHLNRNQAVFAADSRIHLLVA